MIPLTVTNTFQNQAGPIPLSQLDANFGQVFTALNDAATYSNFFLDTGTANNVVLTINSPMTFAYATGIILQFKIAASTTTTTPTINVNGLGAKTIVNADGGALINGQTIAINSFVVVQYDGGAWRLIGGQGVTKIGISAAGNVTIAAPTNGSSINIQGVTGNTLFTGASPFTQLINFNTTSTTSYNGIDFSDVTVPKVRIGALFGGAGSTLLFGTSNNYGSGITNTALQITSSADLIARGVAICKYKAADQSKSATTTPANDSDLIYTIPSAGVYAFDLAIKIGADATSSAGGIKWGINFSGTFAGSSKQSYLGLINAAAITGISTSISSSVTVAVYTNATVTNSSNSDWIRITGTLDCSTTGVIGFNWAQNSSTGGNLTIQRGSWMTVTQLS